MSSLRNKLIGNKLAGSKLRRLAPVIITATMALPSLSFFGVQPGRDVVLSFYRVAVPRSAMVLYRNDSLIAERNANMGFPMVGMSGIVAVIEYAAQAANGKLKPDEMVDTAEVNRYFLPLTDRGLHGAWLAAVNDKITNGKISLSELTKGIVMYGSVANTEWLIDRVGGPDAIAARMKKMGFRGAAPACYPASSMLAGLYLYPGVVASALEEKLKKTPVKDIVRAANAVHKNLAADSTYKVGATVLNFNIQNIISEKVDSARASDYATLMARLNSKKYFDAETHKQLDPALEYLMEIPANRTWLKHGGMLRGANMFSLARSFYATDTAGNHTEMVYMFRNLSARDKISLDRATNDFELAVLTDGKFREKLRLASKPDR